MKKQQQKINLTLDIDGNSIKKKDGKRSNTRFKNLFSYYFFRKTLAVNARGQFFFDRAYCKKNSLIVLSSRSKEN